VVLEAAAEVEAKTAAQVELAALVLFFSIIKIIKEKL
jgi:hypothetical protein